MGPEGLVNHRLATSPSRGANGCTVLVRGVRKVSSDTIDCDGLGAYFQTLNAFGCLLFVGCKGEILNRLTRALVHLFPKGRLPRNVSEGDEICLYENSSVSIWEIEVKAIIIIIFDLIPLLFKGWMLLYININTYIIFLYNICITRK